MGLPVLGALAAVAGPQPEDLPTGHLRPAAAAQVRAEINAPHGFMIYWRADVTAIMDLHDAATTVTYLIFERDSSCTHRECHESGVDPPRTKNQ
jgi:hypothetical protein